MLPVETDVLPEDFGRANAFEEANHSIDFTVSTDEAAAETVAQMVAQRIAGDYQLVEDAQERPPSLRRDASQPTLEGRVAQQMDRSLHNARDLFPPSQRRRSRTRSRLFTLCRWATPRASL